MAQKEKLSDQLQSLRKRVAKAPAGPGVYRWLDEAGRVLCMVRNIVHPVYSE